MNNQIRVEWFKLQRNRTFWVLLISSIALSSLLHYLVIVDWWQMHNTPFDKVGLSEFNAFSTFTVPLFFNLFVSTLAGFFISNEFSQSSVIKNQIISGSKRSHIYLAKYLKFSLGSIIIVILIPILTVIMEVVLLGYGDLLNPPNLVYLGRALGLFTLQFLGFTAIILLLAILTEDSGKTIILSVLFTIIMFVVEKLPQIPFLSTVYENSIFYQISEVFKFSITNGEILNSIFIAVVTIFLIITCGIYVFNRKEIK